MSVDKLSVEAVKSFGDGKFSVQSQSEPTREYVVDLTTGMCSCTKGENGAICKHQIACADNSMMVVPQIFVMTSESWQWLAALALGPEKTPKESFFKHLSNIESHECKQLNDVNSFDAANMKMETDGTNMQMGLHGIVKMEVDIPDEVMSKALHSIKETIPDSQPVIEHNGSSADSQPVIEDNSRVVAKSRIAAEMLIEATARFGNSESLAALDKFMQCIKALKSTNQYHSLLHGMRSSMKNGGAG